MKKCFRRRPKKRTESANSARNASDARSSNSTGLVSAVAPLIKTKSSVLARILTKSRRAARQINIRARRLGGACRPLVGAAEAEAGEGDVDAAEDSPCESKSPLAIVE